MLRNVSLALLAFVAAPAAQQVLAQNLGAADSGDEFILETAPELDPGEAEIEFILRPSQEADGGTRSAYAADPGLAPIGPPLAGPAEPRPSVDDPVGPPLAGPALAVSEPARPRRPREDDPFAATGIKLGSFILRPTFEIGVSASDNVAGGRDEEGALGVVLAAGGSVLSENDRHGIEAELSGEGIFYGDREFDQRQGKARLRARYDLTSRTTLEAGAGYSFNLDSYTDPDTPEAAVERPAVHDLDASLGATQRFGRLSLGARAAVQRTVHEEVALAGGGTAPREELDNTEYGVFVRSGYEASAALTPFAEIGVGRRDYDIAVDTDGFERSSLWGELRGGVIFDGGSKLRGEAAVGARREDLDDDDLEDISAFLADASILWSPRRLTEIRLEVGTDVRPTGLPGSSGSLLYSAELSAARQFGARFRLEGGAGLDYENFVGIDREDVTLSAFAGLSYSFSRRASAVARYRYERTDSSDPGGDFDENVVSVRLRLQR